MNNNYLVEVIIGGVTFICSIATSAFIAGSRWQEVRGDLKDINRRLGAIEGMFTLQLRDPHDGS